MVRLLMVRLLSPHHLPRACCPNHHWASCLQALCLQALCLQTLCPRAADHHLRLYYLIRLRNLRYLRCSRYRLAHLQWGCLKPRLRLLHSLLCGQLDRRSFRPDHLVVSQCGLCRHHLRFALEAYVVFLMLFLYLGCIGEYVPFHQQHLFRDLPLAVTRVAIPDCFWFAVARQQLA